MIERRKKIISERKNKSIYLPLNQITSYDSYVIKADDSFNQFEDNSQIRKILKYDSNEERDINKVEQ